MSEKATCSIDGCERSQYARCWCHMHYQRWRKHGDPFWQLPTLEARFWANINQHGPDGFHSQTGENLGPCWLWTASTTSKGYGQMRADGRNVQAHRFAYEMLTGPIPPGLQLDHLCRVRHCVRPNHLEPVTNRENVLRGDTIVARCAAKTHCLSGHAFSPENTYVDRNGGRKCRTCRRGWAATYLARKKAG